MPGFNPAAPYSAAPPSKPKNLSFEPMMTGYICRDGTLLEGELLYLERGDSVLNGYESIDAFRDDRALFLREHQLEWME